MRKLDEQWVEHLVDVKGKQSNTGIEIPALVMCLQNKSVEDIRSILHKQQTMTNEEVSRMYSDHVQFSILGGNHSAEAFRRLSTTNPNFNFMKCYVLTKIDDKFVPIIRGVRNLILFLAIIFKHCINKELSKFAVGNVAQHDFGYLQATRMEML